MNDLEYIKKGMFVSFIANTKDGENAFNTMVEQNGSATIQANHLKSVLYQLRKAGYKVCKAKKSNLI